MTEIIIPKELLPVDGRFGCGPSRLRPEQIQALKTSGFELLGTSHRQSPIKNLVSELQEGLLNLFHSPHGYEIVLGNGGSTAFWDVAAYSLIEGETQALVHGEFGAKFAKALSAPFLSKPQILESEVGSRRDLTARAGVKNYVYPQNETSTGVQIPVTRVKADEDALFFTDATSAAGGIAFDPLETDVYYFAPQKNFSSDGGIWLALVSPQAIARAEKIAASDQYIPEFLSFMTALENSRLNQTLNTPAIATLFLINEQVKWINSNGGLAWADQRTKVMSNYIYDWMASRDFVTPFVTNIEHRSQVVLTMDFKAELDAAELAKTLRANGIVDTEPYRKLGRNQLRIATFVSTEPSDVEKVCTAIDYVVERM
ncbi:MAG: phosphoserine transaminase [Micrococcales bacterium]|nr:phosphoserine transaminase [Micrococcales bacterium]